MISTINAGNSKFFADIMIKKDAEDGLIATTIDAENSKDCVDDAAGGLIDATNDVNSMDFDDITV